MNTKQPAFGMFVHKTCHFFNGPLETPHGWVPNGAVAAKPWLVDDQNHEGLYYPFYIGDSNNPRTGNPDKPTRTKWNDRGIYFTLLS
jgi:hypothetical protein